MNSKYDDYKKLLRERLDSYRYIHSLNVAECAESLAIKYGADSEKAYEAGLLHDIMKQADSDEVFEFCEKYNIEMTSLEKNASKLWHAIVGEAYLKYVLNIKDEDILNAVRYHTTGRQGMSLLEKIIFTADFISDDRIYEGVDKLREKANISIELAMEEGLQYTIMVLCGGLKPIHPDTVEAFNEIVGSLKSEVKS